LLGILVLKPYHICSALQCPSPCVPTLQGKVPLQQLDNPAAFDRGAKDVFHVEGIDVGQLSKLVVSVDGRGSRPLWHLDYILVYRWASV
jgi:hypothetical protein